MKKFGARLMSMQCFMRTKRAYRFKCDSTPKHSTKKPSKLISACMFPNFNMIILFLVADMCLHLSF
jgi:hypothetical protein